MAAAPVQQTQTDRDLINMYNEINRLGSNLPSGQITQHQNAYTQIISACRGARGNADEFMRDSKGTLSVAFKAALTENFFGTEAQFNNWYRINAPVPGRNMDHSSFTFGPPQWDLGQGSTRVDRLTAILRAHDWPQSKIDDVNHLLTQQRPDVLRIYQHRNDPGSQESRDWNTILDRVREADQVLLQEAANGVNSSNLVWANYYGYTDPQQIYHSGELDSIVADVGRFVSGLRTSLDARVRAVATYIDTDPEMALAIADRINQYGNVLGLDAAIRDRVGHGGSFDIADYYDWALTHTGIACNAADRVGHVADVAANCGWLNRTADQNRRIAASVQRARGDCRHGDPISNQDLQAAYDQVRDGLAMSAPPVSTQTFNAPGGGTIVLYYGPGNYSNSSNANYIQVVLSTNTNPAGVQALTAAGYNNQVEFGGSFVTHYYGGPPGPAIAEAQTMVDIAASALAQAAGQSYVSGSFHAGSAAVFPGTTTPLPMSVLDAALDPNWASIMPMVAAQASMQDPPALVMDLELAAGQVTPPRGPFDTGWLAPGDGLLVDDGSTIRTVIADGPGETVVAFNGDATLEGRPGNDSLWAGAGNDTLIGGPGDVMHGGSGNDVFVSGPNDVMYAGGGTNIFQVDRGVGQVTVYANGSGADTSALGAGIEHEDVRVVQDGPDLLLKIAPAEDQISVADQIRLVNQVANGATRGPYPLSKVTFADGTVWDAAKLQAKSLIATEPGQVIIGFSGTETLVGKTGGDTLWAGSGSDTLIGGPNDVMYGGPGTDVFVSGRNNVIVAGSGTNAVKFGRQDGQDVLNADAGGTTTVELGTGIDPLDLVFALRPNAAQGHDLQVSVQGRGDDVGHGDDRSGHGEDNARFRTIAGITVPNWDAAPGTNGGQSPVATFATEDAALAGSEVGLLIQAMATFTTDTGMSWEQAIDERPHAVEAILAQHWHPAGRQPIASADDRDGFGDRGEHGHGWSR